MKSELENSCSSCERLVLRNYDHGKFYCPFKHEDHYASDKKCYNYHLDKDRSERDMQSAYDYSVSYQNDTNYCYITTVICDMLGYPDKNYYLNTLRKFRERNKLNPSYQPIFISYDIYGPEIAKKLLEVENKGAVGLALLQEYIVPACMEIEAKNDEKAKEIYTRMTMVLARKFNIDMKTIPVIEIDEETANKIGHGHNVLKLKLDD